MKRVKQYLSDILDYVWPQYCTGCHNEGSLLCFDCEKQIKLIAPNPYPWEEKNTCIVPCYVCLEYSDKKVSQLIKYYKYSYFQHFSDLLSGYLAKQLAGLGITNPIITNIPLHPKKKRQRGFDQTEILTRKLGNKLNLKYHKILERKKYTKAQAQMTRQERLVNLKDVFVISPGKDLPPLSSTIVLIDDVVTTGSTINSAAKCLLDYGYKSVIALVIAKNID